MIPVISIVWLMAIGKSAPYSALMGSLILLVATISTKPPAWTAVKCSKALWTASMIPLTVSITAATAGIIIGGVSNTSLNLIFASQILKFSHNNMLLTLILVAITALVLGMGMTTTAVYITVATILSPGADQAGHQSAGGPSVLLLFRLYLYDHPPVALASYTAAAFPAAAPARPLVFLPTGPCRVYRSLYLLLQPRTYFPGTGFFEAITVIVTSFIAAGRCPPHLKDTAISREYRQSNHVRRRRLLLMFPGFNTDLIGLAILSSPSLRRELSVTIKIKKPRLKFDVRRKCHERIFQGSARLAGRVHLCLHRCVRRLNASS
jgi:hypothetical protein